VGAPAIWDEILTEHDQSTCRYGAGQGLWDRHFTNVRIDRTIERQILGQRVDEHERIVDVSANDRFFGARLSELETPLGGGLELTTEDSFRK
jgi:hypothetical protein